MPGYTNTPKNILERWPWLRHVFADGGYVGPKLEGAMQKVGTFTLKIVTRTDKAKGFEVLPSGWVVELAFRMAGAMPQAGQGLGEIHRFRRNLDVSRAHSPAITRSVARA